MTQQMERKNDFEERLIETTNEVLRKCFGESSQLIYTWLRFHSVNPEEIPAKPDAFANALKTFSGGGSVVETMILRKLCAAYGVKYDQICDNSSFADRIAEMRTLSQVSFFSSAREEQTGKQLIVHL